MNIEESRAVWAGWFSVVLPPEWRFSEQDGVISLYNDKGGVGVLQISLAHRRRKGRPTNAESVEIMMAFAAGQAWGIQEQDISLLSTHDSIVSELSHHVLTDEGSEYWQAWCIVDKNRMATITYNCAIKDAGLEESLRAAIVNSFNWEN